MGNFKINGQVVGENDWASFKEFVLGEFPSAKSYLDDGEVTKDEIIKTLDADGNGKLTYNDLKSVDAGRFAHLDVILKKYGFHVGSEVGKDISFKEYRSVPSYMWKDKNFVLAVVKRDGGALELADEALRGNKKIVLAAVRQYGWAIVCADESLKNDREVALTAVTQDSGVFKNVGKSLINDPDFIYDAALIDIKILDNSQIHWRVMANVWKKLKGFNIPHSSFTAYEEFRKYIKNKYNIEFLGRTRTLIEVLKIRDDPIGLNDPRPLAVAIFPKKDRKGAFESYPAIERLMELGYRVAYYEAGDEDMAERYLSEATDGGKRKADLIVLSGHGTSTTLALSGADLGFGGTMDNEKNYIDTSDFKNGRHDVNLPKVLSLNGDLVLYSCSNGEGKDRNPDSLANTIARILPKGVTVHSSDTPANIARIDRGDDGRIKVEWTEDSLYVTNGRQ